MSPYKLTQINIYPVKSLPGIQLTESLVEERGLQYDRRWMLVDKENMFISQRLFPQMIFIDVRIEDQFVIFTHGRKSIEPLKIKLDGFLSDSEIVRVWDDECFANEYSKEVNEWFGEAINFNCKLVYMPNSSNRHTSTKYYSESKSVSFADGYPFLILGEESLKLLNTKLEIPALMEQFRSNLVFSGGTAHDEDSWKNITIGNVNFTVVKPCARCVMTTIDLNSGNKKKEPLSTLSKYRNFNNKIMFGQNALCHQNGKIRLGDEIGILK